MSNNVASTPSGTHRRRNPLTGEWVLVAPGRDRRPWSGQVEAATAPDAPRYDPECYLCPGNARVGGEQNPDYDSTFVFTNDFAAITPDGPATNGPEETSELFRSDSVRGTCRVICFSPRHDLRMANMSPTEIAAVIELWCDQHAELSAQWRWVQMFENRGEQMGASNPHPHGQIWASSHLPTLVQREDDHQRRYFDRHGSALLADYVATEITGGARVVTANERWAAVVPYWAVWPFETLLVARDGTRGFDDLSAPSKAALVETLSDVLGAYDRLLGVPFPYSMGWHPAPQPEPAGASTDETNEHWVLHAHFMPPLLRAEARKFMVGYELLAEAQRDLTPETAAQRLRDALA